MNELNWIIEQARCLYMLFPENDILKKCIYLFGQKRVTGAPLTRPNVNVFLERTSFLTLCSHGMCTSPNCML